jgi:hypothetical protein
MNIPIVALAVLIWAALTAIVWLWVKAATRRDDDVPDVQPWDERTVTLASGSVSEFVVWDDQNQRSWTN